MLIEQGATVNISLAYKDSNNVAVDLTGYNARMKIRSDYADASPTTYFALSSSLAADGTGITLGGVSGTVGIFISATSTSVVSFDTAYYDLELITGSANPIVTRLIQGTVKLSKEVTR